jgi:glutamyl-tRNA synthetase
MSEKTPARVRFAPSPTGIPHIGTIRQAIFDWLLARNTGGSFILRIEDTDRNRFVPESLEAIYESLRWIGLDWDEGPEVGGPHAPYMQSERLPLYQAAARRLLDEGKAFECYCTPERLDEMRARQRELKQPPGYDGRCRTEAGRAEAKAEAAERPPVVRFKTPDEGVTVVHDHVRGDIEVENSRLDDTVLLKSDGYPTYHLAMPVDDHEMEITHVIRNEEWLPSAPIHKLVFDALGYEMPVLVHTASIVGPDRAKLSKRHGAQSVLEYRDMGYLPDAVFNFLTLLGWSLDDRSEIISRQEFIDNFSVGRIQKSPGLFNLEKLEWMNAEYLRMMPDEELARYLIGWLEKPESEGGLPDHVERALDLEYTTEIIPIVKERIKRGPDARNMMSFFYIAGSLEVDITELLGKTYKDDRAGAALLLSEALILAESTPDWTAKPMEDAYRDLIERLDVKGRDFFGLMRVAITGRSVSPPLFESMELLGRERCVLRLRDAVQQLQ